MTDKEGFYKFSLSGAGITVKDRLISEEKALRMLTIAMSGAEIPREERSSDRSLPLYSDSSNVSHDNMLNPKAFMAQKKPSSEIERLTCLAYYLTHHRNAPVFKTRELTDLNREAAQQTFSNPAVFARNAVQTGYLALAGGGNKQITTLGDAIVQALPDRDKVKAAVEEHRSNRKRRPRRKQKKTTDE